MSNELAVKGVQFPQQIQQEFDNASSKIQQLPAAKRSSAEEMLDELAEYIKTMFRSHQKVLKDTRRVSLGNANTVSENKAFWLKAQGVMSVALPVIFGAVTAGGFGGKEARTFCNDGTANHFKGICGALAKGVGGNMKMAGKALSGGQYASQATSAWSNALNAGNDHRSQEAQHEIQTSKDGDSSLQQVYQSVEKKRDEAKDKLRQLESQLAQGITGR
jgi:hypothetical protein